jgi:hypothetical protein
MDHDPFVTRLDKIPLDSIGAIPPHKLAEQSRAVKEKGKELARQGPFFSSFVLFSYY